MNLSALKRFAPEMRTQLLIAVGRKLDYVLSADTADLRARQKQRDSLKAQADRDRNELIERVAYTWFNRLAALRFLDAEGRHPFQVRVITPATDEETQPEILKQMRMGALPDELKEYTDGDRLNDLLDGRLPTATAGADPQGEVYRDLILAACRYYHTALPFVFEAIDDETELLLPDDLLTPTSVAEPFRTAISDADCEDVEIIGWLYQFYIAEKKDAVFEGLKKNQKITPENIPAATQLFTPHWIVRYLVENSLGRLWMLNRPQSLLVERMDYYIPPEQAETDYLKIDSPEEIKICDPACGSGHMLTYAFDLLYAIYEEEGYEPSSIAEKILTQNLYGIEIDQRAGTLAAFALAMKAQSKKRRFFRNPVQPNICVLVNLEFADGYLAAYIDAVGRDLFTSQLQTTLHQFREADNFGSLIRPAVTDVAGMLKTLEDKNVADDLFLKATHNEVLRALKQADYLSPKYHVVIANPPYMGGKGMNGRLGAWAKEQYPKSKSDLFAIFIERGLELTPKYGYSAMVTMQSWMFLSSYESLRTKLLGQTTTNSMVHMANMVMGIAFGTAATVWKVEGNSNIKGAYCYVEYEDIGADNKPKSFPPHNERNQKASSQGWFYRASANDFQKIPGSPIAYFLSDTAKNIFSQAPFLRDEAEPRQGLISGDTERFLRVWNEVNISGIGKSINSREEAKLSTFKWFPIDKGGEFRKWYGNNDYVVNWENDGDEIQNFTNDAGKLRSRPQNMDYYFRPGATWTKVTSGFFSVRKTPNGHIFSDAGMKAFSSSLSKLNDILGFLNSKLTPYFLKALSETLNYEQGKISRLPILK